MKDEKFEGVREKSVKRKIAQKDHMTNINATNYA